MPRLPPSLLPASALALGVPLLAAVAFGAARAPYGTPAGAFGLGLIAVAVAWLVRRERARCASEGALRASETRFRNLARYSSDALTVLDAEGVVRYASDTCARTFGLAPDALVGARFFERLHADDRAGLEADFARCVDGAPQTESVFRVRDGAGLYRWIAATGTNLLDDPAVGAVAITSRDVTERVETEAALLAAREAAQSADRAKSAFLANMSHEIRTPMNGVVGMTELLLTTALTDEQREYAAALRASGDALLALIDRILDFSKIEAGAVTLDERPFAPRDTLEAALDVVASRAHEKGLALVCSVDEAVPATLVGDEHRLRQVLLNLLDNAVTFTDAGEVVVRVTARPVDEAWPGGEVRPGEGVPPGDGASGCLRAGGDARAGLHEIAFAVRDTGVGIAAAVLPTLFERFTQADTSSTRRHEGAGLGLAIAGRLAERMGGAMHAESTEGRGSTFRFAVRMLAVPGEAGGAPGSQDEAGGLTGLRALVVIEHATSRRVLAGQLERWGLAVAAVRTADEALGALGHAATFDVVVIDDALPGTASDALARTIRARHGDAAPAFVLLASAGAAPDDGGHLFRGRLAKPVKLAHLREALRAATEDPASNPDADGDVGAAHGFGDAEAAPRRHGLRVLLVEDHPMNQRVALRYLDRLGYAADHAGDGAVALEALVAAAAAGVPYDVVLMDIQMPVMDGVECVRRLRADVPVEAQPYVVALTANALVGDRERFLAAGMDDYLAKPVRLASLEAAFARGFAASPASPAAAPPAVLDASVFAMLCRTLDDPAVFAEVTDDFERSLLAYGADAARTARAGDFAAVAAVAHRVRGSAGVFGLAALAAHCARLEDAALQGRLADAHRLANALPVRVADALGALAHARAAFAAA